MALAVTMGDFIIQTIAGRADILLLIMVEKKATLLSSLLMPAAKANTTVGNYLRCRKEKSICSHHSKRCHAQGP